jgi:hypothetical protein
MNMEECMSLERFSNTIHSVVPSFFRDRAQIDQVCSNEYQTSAEVEDALNGFRDYICGTLSFQLQAVFDGIVGQLPRAAPANVLRKRIIEQLPNGRRIPQICGLLCDEQGAVLDGPLLERCTSNDPILLFRAFGIKLSGRKNEIQNFERNARIAYKLLPPEDQIALGGEISLDRAIKIFQKADEVAQRPFIQNASDGIFESSEAHQARATVLRGLIEKVGDNICNIEFIFGQRIRDRAIVVRNHLPEADQVALDGEITIRRAIQIFRAASDESLLRLFRDVYDVPPLTGEREQDVKIIRTWLQMRGGNIQTINASNKGLLRFPPELFFCPHLLEIDLSDNQIWSLPAEIAFFYELKRLNLYLNELGVLPYGVTCLSSLTHLNIGSNRINYVPDLSLLENLEDVNLSDLDLDDLDCAFLSLKSLQRVDFTENETTKLDDELEEDVLERLRSGELRVDITSNGSTISLLTRYSEESSFDDDSSMEDAVLT